VRRERSKGARDDELFFSSPPFSCFPSPHAGEELLASAASRASAVSLSATETRAHVRQWGAEDGGLLWEDTWVSSSSSFRHLPSSISTDGATVAAVHEGALRVYGSAIGALQYDSSSATGGGKGAPPAYLAAAHGPGPRLHTASVPASSLPGPGAAAGLRSVTLQVRGPAGGDPVTTGSVDLGAPVDPAQVLVLPLGASGASIAVGAARAARGVAYGCSGVGLAGYGLWAPSADGASIAPGTALVSVSLVADGAAPAPAVPSSAGSVGSASAHVLRADYADGSAAFLLVDHTASSCAAAVSELYVARGPASVASGSFTGPDAAETFLVVAETHRAGAAGEGGEVRFVTVPAVKGAKPLPVPSASDDGAAAAGSSGGIAPVPLSALGITAGAEHGAVARVTPVRFARSDGRAGWRAFLVFADGASAVVQSGKAVWVRHGDGDACTAQVVAVDVPHARSGGRAAGAAAAPSLADDPALSFAVRLAGQAGYVRDRVVGAATSAAANLARFAADPVAAVLGAGRTRSAGPAGGMVPGVEGALDAVLVLRTRTDGHAQELCGLPRGRSTRAGPASTIQGSLVATYAESGAELWRMTLPRAAGARAAAAAGAGAGAAAAASSTSTILVSRPRPLQSHPAELLLIETAPAAGGKASGAPGATSVFLTWIDAATGAELGSATYTAATPLVRTVRTPVVHAAFQRETFALVHADESVVVAPGPADVVASLTRLGPDFVVAGLTYDVKSETEGAAGHTLTFSPAPAGVTLSAAGSTTTVPLAAASLDTVWQAQLASASAGHRILAVATGGGLRAPTVFSSGLGAAADTLVREAFAFAGGAGEASDATAAAGSVLAAKGVQVLGDDSLYLKYTSPHVIAVVVGHPGPAHTPFERARARERAASHAAQGAASSSSSAAAARAGSLSLPPIADKVLTVFLYDAVTGRLVHVRRHTTATGPVTLLTHDHWAVVTYWNPKGRRQELVSSSMYEGAIDRCGSCAGERMRARACVSIVHDLMTP
jgi:hypothetical protein